MKNRPILVLLITSVLLFVMLQATQQTFAPSNDITLKAEQHWETYGCGGTCIPGSHNLFVVDMNDDGVMEIITGGFSYKLVNGTIRRLIEPLKIWNWNGKNFTLEISQNLTTYSSHAIISCVYAGDADGNGEIELITAGYLLSPTGNYTQLRIWQLEGSSLKLKTDQALNIANFASINSIFISDVDNDCVPEIITVGRYFNNSQRGAQLTIWHWNGKSLTLGETVKWCASNDASANSVYAHDLNGDGEIEIITCGYDNDLENSSGQIRIWHWKNKELSLKAVEEWRMVDGVCALSIAGNPMGNTIVNNVKVGNVDDDEAVEVVTGGFTYDGDKVKAQLRIWSWNGLTLILEKSHEWTTGDITEIKSIALGDVDGDRQQEIVTSGVTGGQGGFMENATTQELAQLRVFGWNGTALTLEESQDWRVGEGTCAWNIAAGDLNNDGTVEIVTVGCMYINKMCDPDMRIWSVAQKLSSSSSPLPSELTIAALASLAVIALAGGYLLMKKLKMNAKTEVVSSYACEKTESYF